MPDVREARDDAATAAPSPDYPLPDEVVADTPAHLKAMADPTRSTILDLVLERAATTTELATALGKPKGTVDHHLKVLERVGLVRVVRTRRVRALEERFWGRTGRTIVITGTGTGAGDGSGDGSGDEGPGGLAFLRSALREARPTREGDAVGGMMATLRHVRIPAERAEAFAQRIAELAAEFTALPRGGDVVYGFVAAVYPTDLPTLPDPPPHEETPR